MPKLIGILGPLAGQKYEFDQPDVMVGRAEGNDLRVEEPSVSSQHARLFNKGGQWQLADLGSSNGTFINKNEIHVMTAINDGDEIMFGETSFRFITAPAAQATPPASVSMPAPNFGAPDPAPPPPPTPSYEPPPPPPSAPIPPPEMPKPSAYSPPPRVTPPQEVQATEEELALIREMKTYTERIRDEVAKVIIGQHEVLEQVLMCMMAGGHSLLVGLPGLAKTTMISTISKVLQLNFKRIQFTPDLMPTDITGTDVLETNKETNEKEFRFMQGPLFANMVLADEINRTPPKTQAALLEAMQERMVTVGTKTYQLELPFFVLATQNPIEQEGTYPLPEAQMDRFMFNIWVDYPEEHEEEQIVASTTVKRKMDPLPVLSKDQVIQLQEAVSKIPVSPHVIKFAIQLVRSTRPKDERAPDFIKENVSVGAGPRAGQYLILGAKARAVIEGRIHVSCNDVRRCAVSVLRHRIFTNFAADSEGLTAEMLIERLLNEIEEPSERDYANA